VTSQCHTISYTEPASKAVFQEHDFCPGGVVVLGVRGIQGR